MTLSYQSKKDYEEEKRKERSEAYDSCFQCGLEIHEQEWVTDEEARRFCDGDCKKFYKEETQSQ